MSNSSFYILLFLSLFTPNTTFLGNLCGIFSAYIIRIKFGYIILPKFYGVYDFEQYFNLNIKNWYISLIEPNQEMKEIFSEIFTNIDFLLILYINLLIILIFLIQNIYMINIRKYLKEIII